MSRVGAAVLCLLAPVASPDGGCPAPVSKQQRWVNPRLDKEIPYPGDPRVNEGAQGRINAITEEQDQARGPASRRPPLSW